MDRASGSSQGNRRRQLPPNPNAPASSNTRPRTNIFPPNYYTPINDTPICTNTEDARNYIPPQSPHYYQYSQDDSQTQPPSPPYYVEPTFEIPQSSTSTPVVAPVNPPRGNKERARHSFVWKYFDLKVDESGHRTSKCKIPGCDVEYQLDHGARGSTSSMRRHLEIKHPEQWALDVGTASSSSGNYNYDHDLTRSEFARLVASQKLPFCFGEKKDFEKFVKMCLNPSFYKISRRTLVRDLKTLYHNLKCFIINTFDAMNERVAFTADSWTAPNSLRVIGITVHWIDSDWKIEKRIICFQSVVYSMTADFIYTIISEVVNDFA